MELELIDILQARIRLPLMNYIYGYPSTNQN